MLCVRIGSDVLFYRPASSAVVRHRWATRKIRFHKVESDELQLAGRWSLAVRNHFSLSESAWCTIGPASPQAEPPPEFNWAKFPWIAAYPSCWVLRTSWDETEVFRIRLAVAGLKLSVTNLHEIGRYGKLMANDLNSSLLLIAWPAQRLLIERDVYQNLQNTLTYILPSFYAIL